MKFSKLALAAAAAVLVAFSANTAMAGFELGLGANYWYSLKDAANEKFDEDGLGWMISSRWMWTDYIGLGLELERSPENFVALDESMYAPSAHLIVGKGLYIGCGVGCYYYDGDFYGDAWYNLRLGVKAVVIDPVVIDVNLNYRADSFEELEDVKDADGETLTVGAALRIDF